MLTGHPLISLWPVLSIEEQFKSRDELSSAFFPLTMIDLPLKSKSGQKYVHNLLIHCSDVKRPSLERGNVFLKLYSVYACLSVGDVGKKLLWEIGCQFHFK